MGLTNQDKKMKNTKSETKLKTDADVKEKLLSIEVNRRRNKKQVNNFKKLQVNLWRHRD